MKVYIRGPRVGPVHINARITRKGVKVAGARSLRWSAFFTASNKTLRKF